MITGISHVNLSVPEGTLEQAAEFYEGTLGFTRVAVPVLQKDSLAWFDIIPSGQQIHIAFDISTSSDSKSRRHPCFKIDTMDGLNLLRARIYDHYVRGEESSPLEADRPGEDDSGAKGVEYPTRFFARDYAGNRLEFSL